MKRFRYGAYDSLALVAQLQGRDVETLDGFLNLLRPFIDAIPQSSHAGLRMNLLTFSAPDRDKDRSWFNPEALPQGAITVNFVVQPSTSDSTSISPPRFSSTTEFCEAMMPRLRASEDAGGGIFLFVDAWKEWITRSKEPQPGKLAQYIVAVKDNIAVQGLRCTAGSRILENFVAPYHAFVVQQLLNERAWLLPKVNLDEFGWKSRQELAGGFVGIPVIPRWMSADHRAARCSGGVGHC